MKVAISQPTYLPWLGYFDLMDQVDTFVLLDNVQFEKQSWQQRNRIKTAKGLEWISVPVKIKGRSSQRIGEVEIAEPDFWQRHVNVVRAHYHTAKYFADYFPCFATIVEESRLAGLAVLNARLIEWLMASFGVRVPLVLASSLNVVGQRSGLNVAICRQLSATNYYSAIGSAVYLLADLNLFVEKGIDVCFQNYTHPEYQQLFPPFCPYASALDVLFNEGPRSMEIIRSGRREPLSPAQVALRQA